jgi:hypothetical protein
MDEAGELPVGKDLRQWCGRWRWQRRLVRAGRVGFGRVATEERVSRLGPRLWAGRIFGRAGFGRRVKDGRERAGRGAAATPRRLAMGRPAATHQTRKQENTPMSFFSNPISAPVVDPLAEAGLPDSYKSAQAEGAQGNATFTIHSIRPIHSFRRRRLHRLRPPNPQAHPPTRLRQLLRLRPLLRRLLPLRLRRRMSEGAPPGRVLSGQRSRVPGRAPSRLFAAKTRCGTQVPSWRHTSRHNNQKR